MTQFLLETLLWTGALIAAVLLLRRPVTRMFGPQAAYALWALPLLRLFLPPITLPAWMKPETAPAGGEILIIEETVSAAPVLAQQAAAVPATFPSPVDLMVPLMAIWLGGAVLFVARRITLYFAMRRELLEDAVPVGEAEGVRLVETPATKGPLAFGVFDKVIALPEGFMIRRDRQTRDLAIAHELAHHRGNDLLVNFLVQPLFALHWFNPLGWAGWRALRRDQEAACDARVVASRSRDERAHYADIIAGFATTAGAAPARALAAPMACPVLGDKSIIHRLRSLTMSDISPRRRFAGRALLIGGALALPLTASISYAASESGAFEDLPEAPAAPAAPQPPAAPFAPQAPEAPAAGERVVEVEVEIDEAMDEAERAMEKAEKELEWIEKREGEGKHRVIRVVREEDEDGEKKVVRRVIRMDAEGLSEEERAELRAEMAELRKEFGEGGELRREIKLAFAEARGAAPKVVMTCKGGSEEIVSEGKSKDGEDVLFVCKTAAMAQAREALEHARAAIKTDRNLSESERKEALRSIKEAEKDLKDAER